MSRRGSMAPRLVLLTLACAAIGVASMMLVAARSGPWVGERAGEVIDRARGLDLHACASHPSAFAARLDDGLEIHAYDGTLRARNDGAPLVPDVLRRRRAAGMRYPLDLDFAGPFGGHMLLPGDPDPASPCHVLLARWPQDPTARRTFLGEAALSIGIVLASTLGLLAWLAIRPLARRIEGLRKVAVRLDAAGRGHGPDAPRPPSELRDLGEIEDAMERSIARIGGHIAELLERRHAMERFLADVAHDVKTPLSSIHLSVDELAMRTRDPEATDAIRRLTGDVVYLRNLFENLAIAARLRDGSAPPGAAARFDLRDVVARVTERARVLARRTGIELAVAVPRHPVLVRADETLAEQALTNLADNALLHGASGEHLSIVLATTPRGFSVRVLDDGPGVPETTLPRLGERTFRSDEARRRDPRGSGLGLAIVTEACERAGWSFTLRRVEPRGLEASIEGPVVSSQKQA